MSLKMKRIYKILLELLIRYIKYASSDEAIAVLFVKKELKKSKGHWIYGIYFESYQDLCIDDLEFKFVLC